MMKGFIVVVTAVLTYIFLKRKQLYHHYIGIFLVVSGVFTVGTTVYFNSSESENKNLIIGMIFILIG